MSQEVCPVSPGDVVGAKYRVERVLGSGGMGVVVAAVQIELDRRVALKFLLPKVAQRRELVARFGREARAAAKLESEHVARVFDVGAMDDGAPYIVMEYLEGQDLAAIIRAKGALACDEAVGYMLQACEAVAEAHANGIIHRDLKPGNLFLAQRSKGPSTIKVLDFGLSKFSAPGEENVTSESSLLGSPLYMSPEQLMSARAADARSDVWSLGVVLYEMLTAHSPFHYERIAGLVAAILQKAPQPIEAWRTDVPPGLVAVVSRCLEKTPERRFETIAQFAAALVAYGPPGGERSLERIAHVRRTEDENRPAPARVAVHSVGVEREVDPPPAESIAGSSTTLRRLHADVTLPSAPQSTLPPAPKRTATRGAALGAVGIAAVGAFLARAPLTAPPAASPTTPSASPSVVSESVDSRGVAPVEEQASDAGEAEKRVVGPSRRHESPPAHIDSASSIGAVGETTAKPRARPVPSGSPSATPSSPSSSTKAPPTPPADPLNRLHPL